MLHWIWMYGGWVISAVAWPVNFWLYLANRKLKVGSAT